MSDLFPRTIFNFACIVLTTGANVYALASIVCVLRQLLYLGSEKLSLLPLPECTTSGTEVPNFSFYH